MAVYKCSTTTALITIVHMDARVYMNHWKGITQSVQSFLT